MTNWGEIVNGELGKPFQWGGRGEDAYDCWGLVIRVYGLLGRPVPRSLTWTSESPEGVMDEMVSELKTRSWEKTENPVPGDILATGLGHRVHHVGVVTPFGILHTVKKHGVVVTSEAVLRSLGYQHFEYYRWAK